METITFDFCSNLGGLNKIYAIPRNLLESITNDYTKKQRYLNLTSNEGMIEIYCTPDTMKFTEEKAQTSAGPAYNPVITGSIPKANEPNQDQLSKLESDYWLLLFEDENGNMRLAGDEDSSMILNRNEDSGKAIQDKNQTAFTFSGMQSHPCYYIYKVFIAAF